MKTIIGATLLALTVSLTPQTQLTPEIEQPLERISTKATVIEQGDFKPVALASAKVVRSEPEKPTQGTQTSNASGSVESLIVKWANHYGVSPSTMLRVAHCESTMNPLAQNKGYYAGGGNPSGLFQFLPETFARYQRKAGLSGLDVFNADHNARVAAYAFSVGGASEWECK